MRERLKTEALGAVLAWIVAGAAEWQAIGTAPPRAVTDLTADYLADQDEFTQWLEECCERRQDASESSGTLYRAYVAWCDRNGSRAKSNRALSTLLVEVGFERRHTMIGKVFSGLKLREENWQ